MKYKWIYLAVLALTLFTEGSADVDPKINVQNGTTITLDEDTPVGKVVFKCNGTDDDSNVTLEGTLSYNFFGGNEHRTFSINAMTGEMYLVRALHYEMVRMYMVTLKVTDGVGRYSFAYIYINVTNVNDNPPSCQPSLIFGSLKENATPYTQFATLNCSDPDDIPGTLISVSDNAGDKDTIGASASNNSAYNVRIIDYDAEPQHTFQVQFYVSDGTLRSSATAILSVDDVDDNTPVFNPKSFTGTVLNHADLGHVVVTVSATDADAPNTPASFITFESQCTPDWLMIDRHSGDLMVSADVDYLQANTIHCNLSAYSQSSSKSLTTATVTVNNTNTGVPTFSQAFYSSNLTENSAIGTTFLTLSASDPENDTLNYTTNPANLSISSNGVLSLAFIPDYETQTSYLFKLTVTDKGSPPLSSDSFVQLTIDPKNEYYPQLPATCTGSVSENSVIGTSVLTLTATDADAGLDGAVSYRLLSQNVPFSLDTQSGLLQVAGYLDYETTNSYTVEVEASDNSTSIKLTNKTSCTITILDVPDETLSCSTSPSVVSQTYPYPPGAVAQVTCPVKDPSILNFTFFSGNDDSVFEISPTGAITFGKNAATRMQYSLVIQVDYGTSSTRNTLVVLLEQKLTFTNLPASINVTEELVTGLIFTVTSCCVFPKVTYTLKTGNDDTRITLTTSNGQIRLMVPYDREQQAQRLYQIEARSESGQSVESTLTVNVLDINDWAPQFPFDVDEIPVEETLSNNTVIHTYTATDKDAGNNATLTYNITAGNDDGTFSIDPSSGYLTLAKSLNYHAVSTYQLRITATDGGSPRLTGDAVVIVKVVNKNQSKPILIPIGSFPNSSSVSEAVALGTSIFRVQAAEDPSSPNSTFMFELISGNIGGAFGINPVTGIIRVTKFLDRETIDSYLLNVSATDQTGNVVFGLLTMTVLDVNDNNPVLSTGVFVFSIPDKTPSGYRFAPDFNVTDPDLAENGTVTLSVDGLSAAAFEIENRTLITKATMDYPTKSRHEIVITASDGGTPSRTTRALCIVLVTNGNIPFFNVTVATVSMSESTAIGSLVYDLNATDKMAVEDGSIKYTIVRGNIDSVFLIREKTGQVVVATNLDYERTPQYNLTIEADNVPSSNQQATFVLTVLLLNENEHDPVFKPQFSISFDVDENATSNTVVGLVEVTDADSGSYGIVTETMTGPPGFELNNQTRQILVKATLNYLVQQFYVYTITAVDGGSPPRQALASVTIRITDVNNQYPVFLSASAFSVPDSVPVNSTIYQIYATDLDTGEAGRISYEITSTSSLSTFSLDSQSGIIVNKVRLNALITPSYTVEIKAVDHGNPSLSNTTTLTITVESTEPNNYAPEFTNTCPTTASVARNSIMGDPVVDCSATDLDQGVSGQVIYRIKSGNQDGYFLITDRGQVVAGTSLVRAQNSYSLVVEAMDKGQPPFNCTQTVTISIIPPISGNIRANYTFSVDENKAINTVVGEIKIDDGRSIKSCSVASGNFQDAFKVNLIDATQVDLVVIGSLDAESYPMYSLVVSLVTDVDTISIIVEVLVNDTNDNPPLFDQSSLSLQLAEHSPVGQTLYTISYTDRDIEERNRNNTLDPESKDFTVDEMGHLISAVVPDYETQKQYLFNIYVKDNQPPLTTSTLSVTINIIDVPEEELRSPSSVTDDALISLEAPYQASVGHRVYTLQPGDFGLFPAQGATVQYVAYKTSSPFSIHSDTGDITVTGPLANQSKYFLWTMIQVTKAANTTSKVSLIRIDTFDRATQMVVLEFPESLTNLQYRIQQFLARAQTYFPSTQRVGFCNLLDTSTGTRRRLLAVKSAAFVYVVNDTSADDMKNVNEPKQFLSEKQILNVLQASPDGTPVLSLSDPSVVAVETVEPYEETRTSSDFDSFISTPAGIAVFCLLGLLLLALVVLVATCLWYRKCRQSGQKQKNTKKKTTAKKTSFSKMSEGPPYYDSNPQIIVSAPPPVTLHSPPPTEQSSPFTPDKPGEEMKPDNLIKKQHESSDLPSQYSLNQKKNNPAKKSKKDKASITKVKTLDSKNNKKLN